MGTIPIEAARPDVLTRCSELAEAPVSKVTIVASDHELARLIAIHLDQSETSTECRTIRADALVSPAVRLSGAVVYVPSLRDSKVPDVAEAAKLFAALDRSRVEHFVLVSSAAVYDASFRNPGLVSESYGSSNGKSAIATEWRTLETIANRHFQDERLTILRCAILLSEQWATPIAKLFMRRVATTLPGYDPVIQLLSPADLAQAIGIVLRSNARGLFNVAPDSGIPLLAALKQAGVKRVPIPRTILRVAHTASTRSTCTHLDYARYSWTISNDKLKAAGFRPAKSSAQALSEFRGSIAGPNHAGDKQGHEFDTFGMDKSYIASYGRTIFRFLADWYWRIEVAGIEHIPESGRAVLAGVHRGFMPFDGVMALDLIVKKTGRYPRFLIHPGLLKFPFLANFMTKLGGIVACQENAARVLESGELLGVFPEGIQGAFVRYAHAYKIHDFHRDAFVKMALRHRAPIIPFVTVGSAEIFPILGKLKSRWWTNYSGWPEFPFTPTFPLLPLPLPSKWHTHFLPALHVEAEYPASAAANTSVVRAISGEVRNRMQKAIDEMLRRRRSIFFGSVFAAVAK